MGAFTGPITIRRYTVHGDTPTTDRILKGIRAHVQVPIDPEGGLETAIGWADAIDPSDTDLTVSKVFRDSSVVLGLRIDTLKPPAPVVKRLVAARIQQFRQSRISRTDKREIKDEVVQELRRRYYPTIKSVDVVWDVPAQYVLFWSHGKQTNEWLVMMFKRSFDLDLTPFGPGIVAKLKGLLPTPEMLMGFPGLPGRPVAGEDADA